MKTTQANRTSRRRDSLPSTIESSTVATEAKAKRRQSIRRESIAEFKARAKHERAMKELYSPPQTRSAKKQQNQGVMSFSPPDQELNERMEKERVAKAEYER